MKKMFLFSVFCCFLLPAFSFSQDSSRVILIETPYGNIKLKLYNEIPLHRDNFLKLVEKHFYDSLLFHRVINGFMIQGGDPDSKNAPPRKTLGEGDVGYTIPAEFNPKLFHKRGSLAAARNSDEVNPEQASSGCQFYIVQGKVFMDSLLYVLSKRITRMKAYNIVVRKKENKELIEKYMQVQKEENPDNMKKIRAEIDALTEEEMQKLILYQFSEEQRKAYTAIGGAPHLDGSYTVFGEVTEGMDVVDKIASVPRNGADRPLTDVRMKISIVK